MANTPNLRSKEQIFGDLVAGFQARRPEINDFSRGSVASQLFTAISQSQFKSSAAVIGMIDASSVDRAVGEALQRIARDKNVPIFSATSATGKITVTDTSFTKISTVVYAGQPAPVGGSLKIYVTDASKFQSANGKIYVGRGTANVEGPLEYSSIQAEAGGAYWSITLKSSSPTTKFHNIGEEIVMAQGGNRTIPAGTVVQTAQGAAVTSVEFRTTAQALIKDGEVTISNVPVICNRPGVVGNVPRGAIREATGFPFSASIFNDNPFFTGREADTDDQIRSRIKLAEQSKARGTPVAIQYFSQNVVAPDELKKVQSSSVVTFADNSAALVFDDGTGYEPLFVGAGFEFVVDSAVGGERELQLRNRPVAQARVKNNKEGPYNIVDYSGLSVQVGGEITNHQFVSSDFKVPSAATPFEIIASINGNPNNNFLASTADGGTKVVLYPKDKLANDIQVLAFTLTNDDANDILGFPLLQDLTLRLYKDDEPLYQDGIRAAVETRSKATWATTIVSGDTLTYTVDGATQVTATFTTTLFQSIDQTATVSYLEDIDTWVQAFNLSMPGVTARVVEDRIEFSSNLGENNRAAISITGGTLKDKIFSTLADLQKEGRASDYTFNRYTGQLSLKQPLQTGSKLTAGSPFTRAKATTTSIPSGPSAAGKLWLIVDGGAETVPNSLNSNTQIRFTKIGTKLTIDAQSPSLVPEGFDNVQPGDWVLVWYNSGDPSLLINNSGFWRVEKAQVGQIIVDDGTVSRPVGSWIVPGTDRIAFVRSDAPIQSVQFTLNPLSTFVNELKSQLVGVDIEIVGGAVRISTQTADETGELYFVEADNGGKNLQLPLQKAITNIANQFGYSQNLDYAEADIPSFTIGQAGTALSGSEFTQSDYHDLGGTDYDFIEMLNNYEVSPAPFELKDSNKGRRSFVKDFDAATSKLTLAPRQYLLNPPTTPPTGSTVQAGDRFFLRSSYQFDSRDQVTVIVDEDPATKTYRLPVARRITVNSHSTPTTSDFSASDAESSLDLVDASSFGSSFSFNDFRCWRQAYQYLTDGTYNLKVKYADWGPAGNRIRAGFVYPSSIDTTSLIHSLALSDVIDINLTLPVKTPKVPNWSAQSCFTAQVTTTGGKDEILYTWRTGTQPDFSSAGVVAGDVAIINNNSSFLSGNKGFSAKVTSVGSLSFSVSKPTGLAVTDNLAAQNIVNQSGIITVTFSSNHNIKANDVIGLWDTAISTGTTRPLDSAYTPTVTSPSVITVPTPSGTPGGSVIGVNHVGGLVTLNVVAHGLTPGNIILVSGLAIPSLNGLYSVYDVPSANTLRYVRSGAFGSAAAGGRVDFQSYGENVSSASVSTISRSGGTVTVSTSSVHGLTAGNLVKVQNTDITSWSIATTYASDAVIKYSSSYYVSLVNGNVGNQPDISPASWAITDQSFNGIWIVDSAPTPTSFTYLHYASGNMSGIALTGSVVKMVVKGSLARGIGGAAVPYLQFGEVGTTAQEVVDYCAQNMSDLLSASVASGATTAPIAVSTEDLDLTSNYITGNISASRKTASTRELVLTSNTFVPAGSRIKVSGMASSDYNNEFIVLSAEASGVNWLLTVWSDVLAYATSTTVETATFYGSTPSLMLKDGDNSVYITALGSLIGSPQFTLKRPWSSAPDLDEELRLVAVNNDQLYRFWNKLVVTGLSNVASIDNNRFGDQLQVTTNLFGSSGSIQFAGGTANKQTLAAVGSSGTLGIDTNAPEGKLGLIYVPYDLRKSVSARQWITVDNEIRNNKIVNFGPTSSIKLLADGIQIMSGPGSFQTQHATTQAADTVLKIEKHGRFFAVIRIAGTSLGLGSAGVKEGSWVKLRNVTANNWSVSTVYSIGARVTYNQVIYTALSGNTGVVPGTNSAVWRRTQLADGNQAIMRVVRTFGQDAFWVESDTMVEEICYLGAAGSMAFYTYDSIMPGDVLVVNTALFGPQNVGRYVVRDEIDNISYQFPSATRLYTDTIQNPPVAPQLLGGEYNQLNIEEKEPLRAWKRVFAVGPGPFGLAAVLVDTPELVARTGSSNGTALTLRSKLEFNEDVNFGVDAYKYYNGLIKELTRVVYGDPVSPVSYPGVRAAGTSIDIQPAIVKRIKIDLSARIRSGLPFGEVRDKIKAAVAGYVNTLGVGKAVSLSKVVAVANAVPGVVAVAVSYPTYDVNNDIIAVGAEETPLVVDPTIDIIVSVIGL